MTSIKNLNFTQRFFQRGLTRKECIESWPRRRASFLAQVNKVQKLELLYDCCSSLNETHRIAILYSTVSLDSFFVLPYVLETLKNVRNISARYFGYEYFFPFFHGYVARLFPCILILDQQGNVVGDWIPRGHCLGEEHAAVWDDEQLSQYAIRNYPANLDLELVAFFGKKLV
ncbi:MAG: hypothetical protein CSA81_04955 [Acidobacteria bacterium]|nr:MAG: hypothetical protein CSA81_04955 [Acidobacteriota bacterium]PIE91061.1 MAG: hypothetical protein CR997_02775 [Acidobacteriota bacterium]